jgi:hypothetical protein
METDKRHPGSNVRPEHFRADWNRRGDRTRHGPDKPGHDGVASSIAFPVSVKAL